MSKVTPRPWSLGSKLGSGQITIDHRNKIGPLSIATVGSEANASYIVKAVNMHDELVEVLSIAANIIKERLSQTDDMRPIFDALAKVDEE